MTRDKAAAAMIVVGFVLALTSRNFRFCGIWG